MIAKRCIEAKLINSRKVYLRLLRDHPDKIDSQKIQKVTDYLYNQIQVVNDIREKESLRGVEGDAAGIYFQQFDSLILSQQEDFKFVMRSKRPPMNRVNAMLSFI